MMKAPGLVEGGGQAGDSDLSIDHQIGAACNLEGDARQQDWLIADIPLSTGEVLAGQDYGENYPGL